MTRRRLRAGAFFVSRGNCERRRPGACCVFSVQGDTGRDVSILATVVDRMLRHLLYWFHQRPPA
jgi:hypothetical protein